MVDESDAELIVLLDEDWNMAGTAPKMQAHHQDTPLHLAFTAYVFDDGGRFLLTRRSLAKRTWPGVWTNSFCGHPLPGEPLERAVRRRLAAELGCTAARIDPVLAAVRYRAVMDNGMVENEVGPVVRVLLDTPPVPNHQEVDSIRWLPWKSVLWEIDQEQTDLSPWSVVTIERLRDLGADPWAWPTALPQELPPPLRCSA
ncbi:isopentenyl-diphosphate Delta-isomerase [Streptomyces sp. NBC_00690]|uniref:isopentenyl-diphosphate Delta-isomerase n=1 Tax=Streptomyces sp. NBC_00690 TaxID=2975808 RepID=UPI002E2B3083|nr:isopentenyl-diphosphate Delta-isomerase [Streptomyces sp. NBC_00690]